MVLVLDMRVYFLLLFLISCTHSRQVKEHREYESIGFSAGVEQYFLSDLPVWINFSTLGSCKRNLPIKYLNFDHLNKSYSLTYEQNVNLQQMLNKKLMSYEQKTNSSKDQNFIFHNIYEQVIGGGRDFRIPQFKKISLVWIDPYLDDHQQLKSIFKGNVLNGHPIIVTNCLSISEAEKLANALGLDSLGVKIISAEMFNVFNENYTGFALDFSKLLPGKEITLFGSSWPRAFLGIDKFIEIGN